MAVKKVSLTALLVCALVLMLWVNMIGALSDCAKGCMPTCMQVDGASENGCSQACKQYCDQVNGDGGGHF